MKLYDQLVEVNREINYALDLAITADQHTKSLEKLVCELQGQLKSLQAQNDALNLELANPIDMEEYEKHIRAVKPPELEEVRDKDYFRIVRALEEIANDYPELSHDKARMQNLDHIKWAKEALKGLN